MKSFTIKQNGVYVADINVESGKYAADFKIHEYGTHPDDRWDYSGSVTWDGSIHVVSDGMDCFGYLEDFDRFKELLAVVKHLSADFIDKLDADYFCQVKDEGYQTIIKKYQIVEKD